MASGKPGAVQFGIEMTVDHLVVESVCIAALNHKKMDRPTGLKLADSLLQRTRSKIFIDILSKIIEDCIDENSSAWWNKYNKLNKHVTILRKFASMRIAYQLNDEDILNLALGYAHDVLESNQNFMEIVLSTPPIGEKYSGMELFLRDALVRNLDSVAYAYVHEIWDDSWVKAARESSVRRVAAALLESETEPYLQEILERISNTQYIVGS